MPTNGLRILLVDGHSGPANDAATFLLHHFNLTIDVLTYYQYANLSIFQRRTLLSESQHAEVQRVVNTCSFGSKDNLCWRALRVKDYQPLTITTVAAIEKNVDLVLCQFPGSQCALFDRVRVPIAIRFTHRFQHHLLNLYPGDGEIVWSAMLRRWLSDGRLALFVDNSYDAMYLNYNLGIEATMWPTIGSRSSRPSAVKPRPVQWCFCCDRNMARGSKSFVDAVSTMVWNEAGVRVLTLNEARRVESGSLTASTNCTVFLLAPHSLHSYASVEAYGEGNLFVIPSPRLLANWHSIYDLVRHRCPGNYAWRAPMACSVGPDTSNVSLLPHWLSFAEFYSWPNTIQVDSLHHLDGRPALLTAATKLERKRFVTSRKSQWDYMRRLTARAAPRIYEALQQAIRWKREGNMTLAQPMGMKRILDGNSNQRPCPKRKRKRKRESTPHGEHTA